MNTKETSASKLGFALSTTLLMLVLCSTSLFSRSVVNEVIVAQAPDTAAGQGEVFYIVEEMPDFIYKDKHGIFAFSNYVQMQIKYPETEYEPGIQGKVYVSFIVEADGRISTIRIKRSLDKLIDDGVIKIIAHAPKWTPGMQSGKPVRVTYTIPVTFQLFPQ